MKREYLPPKSKCWLFDLYGTIVDMQNNPTDAATPFQKEKGWGEIASSLHHLVASS